MSDCAEALDVVADVEPESEESLDPLSPEPVSDESDVLARAVTMFWYAAVRVEAMPLAALELPPLSALSRELLLDAVESVVRAASAVASLEILTVESGLVPLESGLAVLEAAAVEDTEPAPAATAVLRRSDRFAARPLMLVVDITFWSRVSIRNCPLLPGKLEGPGTQFSAFLYPVQAQVPVSLGARNAMVPG